MRDLSDFLERFTTALDRLEHAPRFARVNHVGRVLDTAYSLLRQPGGAAAAYALAPRFDAAGIFANTDWDHPELLQSSMVAGALAGGERWTAALECLSELRLLAVAEGKHVRSGLSAEQARDYLRAVLALNLEYVFASPSEESRQRGSHHEVASRTLQFIAEAFRYEGLPEQLTTEIWRRLRQRPIHMAPITSLIEKLSSAFGEGAAGGVPHDAEPLLDALHGPSPASRGDPGVDQYAERLAAMDARHLQIEAQAFAESMLHTGVVCAYHAILLRRLVTMAPDVVGVALGLSTTGADSYLTYRDLVHALIEKAVLPETAQCVYGLSCLLERAVLHNAAVSSSMWRQLQLPLTAATRARIESAVGAAQPAEAHLLAGAINILGQPLGVGQGDNPTCQSARALSLWAYSDPDYLLQLLAWAARDDGVLMSYHGRRLSSAFLPEGRAGQVGHDLDPVSLVLAPHLDRVYAEMYRLANYAGEDPHRYVNPEFHGWRVGSGFALAVDVATGQLKDFEDFVRLFYACFHPAYNGGQPVIHPQPVGLAVTDSRGRFVGWHAITILRVTLDQQGTTRVYFYNPNNDSGQNWGHGVVVSTHGAGEFYGESSLPVAQFASRLYLFHYDPLEVGDRRRVAHDELQEVIQSAERSWAAGRSPAGGEIAQGLPNSQQ